MRGYSKKASKTKEAVQRSDQIRGDDPHERSDFSADVLELQQSAGNQAVGRIVDTAEHIPSGIPPGLHPGVQSLLSNSAGRPLDERTLDSMEQAYDFDFGAVRIHTEPAAVESARSLNAEAFTVGRHVVFDKGEYAPQSRSGRLVLAHELAHVIQQSRGGSSSPPRTPASPIERSAEQAANAATHESGPVAVSGASAPSLALRARTPDQYRTIFHANRYWQRKLNKSKDRTSESWPYVETLHNLWWSNDPDQDEGAPDRFREFIDAVWEFQWAHRVELGNLKDGIASGWANGELTPQTAKLWRKLAATPAKTPAVAPLTQRLKAAPRRAPAPPPETQRTAQPVGLEYIQQLTPTFALGPAKIYRAKPSPVGAAPMPPFSFDAIKDAIYKDIISGLRSAQKSTFDKFRKLAAKIPEPGKTAVEALIDVFEEIVGVFITVILFAISFIVGIGTAVVQLILGIAQLVYGILKWFGLWVSGLLTQNMNPYLKYSYEIIAAAKQIPSGLKKLFSDWFDKLEKAPIDEGTLMIGELFGQIFVALATFDAAASKAGQMPKLTLSTNLEFQVGDVILLQKGELAVNVASPAAVTGYTGVYMMGHDVPEAGGPRSTSEAIDELEGLVEGKGSSRAHGKSTKGGIREEQIAAEAGKAMEGPEIAAWTKELGPNFKVIHRTRFPKWLRKIFPGQGRPDMIAINRTEKLIIVGDVTSNPGTTVARQYARQETILHIEKTIEYAERLAGRLPPEFKNYRVVAQERYWELGGKLSRRIPAGAK